MKWLWSGGKGPRDVPEWAYYYLVRTLNLNPDLFTPLKCVCQLDYIEGKLVDLIRIYDPAAAVKTTLVKDFASLDEHPKLIMYEGFVEKETGTVRIMAGAAGIKPSAA